MGYNFLFFEKKSINIGETPNPQRRKRAINMGLYSYAESV